MLLLLAFIQMRYGLTIHLAYVLSILKIGLGNMFGYLISQKNRPKSKEHKQAVKRRSYKRHIAYFLLMFWAIFLFPLSAMANNTPPLRFEGTFGFFAKNLRTGQTISWNENVIFPTASTSKLAVALATYKYMYPNADAVAQERYDEDIDLMMRLSDNDAFYELLDEMDTRPCQPLVRVVDDLGLSQTKIHSLEAREQYHYSSVTTPYEMAALFERIYWGTFLDREKSEALKTALANTIFHDEIPRLLPGTVMHKVGELDDILCDVGVVDDGENQILISIYTKTDQGADYASDFIASLAARLYNDLRAEKPYYLLLELAEQQPSKR